MRKQNIEERVESRVYFEQLEDWVRERIQGWVQELLEEEVGARVSGEGPWTQCRAIAWIWQAEASDDELGDDPGSKASSAGSRGTL